jgi:hypothetical protein
MALATERGQVLPSLEESRGMSLCELDGDSEPSIGSGPTPTKVRIPANDDE